MKKLFALLLAFAMVASMAACADIEEPNTETKGEGVMTYAEYAAAEKKTEVTIEAYVQAAQSWWDNKITVYTQDQDGAYFLYEMPCTEEESKKLVPGTKIRVTGFKDEWDGEVEIVDISKFEILEGSYIAEPLDVSDILGNQEELIKKMNMLISIKRLAVKSVTYKNDEPGDDIYIAFEADGKEYNFCIERYLTDPETEVYKAAQALKEGDLVAIEGFLYWYTDSPNTHITKITQIAK